MTRRLIIILTALAAIAAFAVGTWLYQRQTTVHASTLAVANADALVRIHAPVMGAANAPVTIVEFFDPSCEACRAFYPHVKKILADYPRDVRLVIRYAPFHQGSDDAVAILELARSQGRFEPVLEALVARQPEIRTLRSGLPLPMNTWACPRRRSTSHRFASNDRLGPCSCCQRRHREV